MAEHDAALRQTVEIGGVDGGVAGGADAIGTVLIGHEQEQVGAVRASLGVERPVDQEGG